MNGNMKFCKILSLICVIVDNVTTQQIIESGFSPLLSTASVNPYETDIENIEFNQNFNQLQSQQLSETKKEKLKENFNNFVDNLLFKNKQKISKIENLWKILLHQTKMLSNRNQNNDGISMENDYQSTNVDDSKESNQNSNENDLIYDNFNENKRSALRSVMARRSQMKENGESFVPSISVGALSNLQGFFDQLKSNIHTLETKPYFHPLPTMEEHKFIDTGDTFSNKKEFVSDYHAKPSGTAAFLHAIRSYRPSQKIRALVAMQPEAYRGSNFHDPNFLWTGLGK